MVCPVQKTTLIFFLHLLILVYCLKFFISSFYSLQLEPLSREKMQLSANIIPTQQLLWGIYLSRFSLYPQWLGCCRCFIPTKESPFHNLLCSRAVVLSFSSTLLCKYALLSFIFIRFFFPFSRSPQSANNSSLCFDLFESQSVHQGFFSL